jgi:hypothetical protein
MEMLPCSFTTWCRKRSRHNEGCDSGLKHWVKWDPAGGILHIMVASLFSKSTFRYLLVLTTRCLPFAALTLQKHSPLSRGPVPRSFRFSLTHISAPKFNGCSI